MLEEWRPVVGFEGIYEVSSLGRVRGVDRNLSDGRRWKGRIISQKTGSRGHKSVRLSRADVHFWIGVHRLVLEAFVGPCPAPGMNGAHNDGIPAHNFPSNLRWDTARGNHADKRAHGTLLWGERNALAKLSSNDVLEIRRLKSSGKTQREIAGMFHVTEANISSIVRGKTWKLLESAA
jgi:hypothetical protein